MSETKFKQGEQVIMIAEFENPGCPFRAGEVVTVINPDATNTYSNYDAQIRTTGGHTWMVPYSLMKKIKEPDYLHQPKPRRIRL